MLFSPMYNRDNFSYFRTAADNWKNSVRHCLSLGQCFHKVIHPGALPYKKGFHWQVAPEKLSVVHQEIIKYLAMTGKTAENYGILTTRLVAGLQAPSITPPASTSYRPAAVSNIQEHAQRTHSNITMCTVSPSVGLVEFQLSPKDMEILHNLGHPLTPGLSPYDYNLLTNPTMQQELSTIVQLIKDESSTEPVSKNNKGKCGSNPRVAPGPVCTSAPPSGQSKPLISTTSNCSDRTAKLSDHSTSSVTHYSTPRANIFIFPPTANTCHSSDTALEASKQDHNSTKADQEERARCECHERADIEYSLDSPAGFTVSYPSPLGLVQEDITTEEEDHNTSYPFICSEQSGDVSLNELNNSSDWEDTEEPIALNRKVEQCLAIDPIEGDWNCWREPSYLDRINTLANSISTQVNSVMGESLDINDCPIECIGDSYKKMSKPERSVRCSQSSEVRLTCTKSKTRSNNLQLSSLKSLIVSIPFVRLMTSRQVKKYCQK